MVTFLARRLVRYVTQNDRHAHRHQRAQGMRLKGHLRLRHG